MSPGHGGLASFNNLISSRICPANERETSRKGPERERPGGARERADADGRRRRKRSASSYATGASSFRDRSGRAERRAKLIRRRRTGETVRAEPAAGPSLVKHNQARDDGFFITRNVAGERVLLIDDVTTSGSAFQSAASALHAAGARVVAAAPIGRYVKPVFNEHTRAM